MKIGMEKTMIMVQEFLVGEANEARYYILDLEEGKVMTTPFTTLANEFGLGTTTLFSGTCLYNVGGRLVKVIDDDDDDDINSNHHLHLGASFLELNIPHLRSLLFEQRLRGDYKWKAFPCMQHPRKNPICASLDGRLYVLGGSLKSFGEVFIPSQQVWEPLDSPDSQPCLTRDDVHYPVLSDEKNKRLLVCCTCALYAYYPSTGKWDLLHDGRRMYWRGLVAFADDVLYFHIREADIVAFDLATKAWLTVKYSSKFTRDVCLLEFQDMLYLGKGVLCLVHNSIASGKTKFTFVLFRVERINPSVIRVTPIDVKDFFFDHDLSASRFMPLRIVCCI